MGRKAVRDWRAALRPKELQAIIQLEGEIARFAQKLAELRCRRNKIQNMASNRASRAGSAEQKR